MEEREFFDERTEPRTHTLTCSKCGVAGEYQLSWIVRRKKSSSTAARTTAIAPASPRR